MISKLVKLAKNTVSKFKPRNGTVFYLKICMMTLSGLRIKLSPCSYVLFILDIVINSIKRPVSCYFYRNDETNIAMRKRVDLSHSNFSWCMQNLGISLLFCRKKSLKTGIFMTIFLRKLNMYLRAKKMFLVILR